MVQRKHGVDPHDAHAAHAEERQDRRNERDAKAAQVAGQDLIRQAEDIRSEENEQAAVADLDDLRVVVENGQQILARQQHDHDGDGGSDDVLAEGQKHGFFAAVDLAGAVVLADKGRARLAEGVEHVVGDDLDVERGARGGHDDGAEAVDGRLDDDVRHREDRALNTGRQTDAHDLAEDGGVDAQLLQLHAHQIAVQQAAQQQHGTDRVGEHRCDGDAVDVHLEHDDEKQVEDHVQDAGDRQRDERHLRVADAAEDGRLEVVEQNDRHAQQVDAQVRERERVHIVRHVEQAHEPGRDELAEDRYDHAADEGRDDGGMHGAVHGLAVAAADGVGDDDVRTERDADEQIQQQADDRAVGADGSHGGRAHIAREIADDGDVGRVEQLPEDAGRGDGQGIAREFIPDRAVEHVQMLRLGRCLHRSSHLFLQMGKVPRPYDMPKAARMQEQKYTIS